MDLTFQMTYNELATEVKFSTMPYILLEGPDDKRLLELVGEQMGIGDGRVTIETAARPKSDPGQVKGNRDKVLIVSELVASEQHRYKFIGFVDREFHGFEFFDTIQDVMTNNFIDSDRILMTLGHSIENYLFSFDLLSVVLEDLTRGVLRSEIEDVIVNKSLLIMEENFSKVLAIACALGLAARDHGLLRQVRKANYREHLRITERKLLFSVPPHFGPELNRKLSDGLDDWLRVTKNSDPHSVMKACDGHLGFLLILVAFSEVVGAVSRAFLSKSKARQLKNSVFNVLEAHSYPQLARRWAETTNLSENHAPSECFRLLGLVA